jgi:hypothetical protein
MAAMVASTAARGRWLFGPGADLLLGCGGAYALVFLALAAAGDVIEVALPLGLLALPILALSIPHYGATLLRVYGRGEDRGAYRALSLWTTLPVCIWFLAGVFDTRLGSALVTLYLTWSPWHYSGQNYGIARLFLHRRGVAVTPTAKRWLLASFALSFGLVFVAAHTEDASATYAPGSLAGASYRFLRLGIPTPLAAPLLVALLGAYALSLVAGVASLRRAGGWRDLAPALAVVALQALWFSVPVLCRATGWLDGLLPFDPARFEYAFLWIAMGHAAQYLWLTSYYARQTGAAPHRAPYLGKCLLAGGAAWGVPILFFGPDLLGVRAFDAGHALLAAAAVNVHHFVLDGAIWKLRDGRIARILLRPLAGGPAPALAPGMAGLLRGAIAAAGIAYLLTSVVATLEAEYGVRRAGDPPDLGRLRLAAERLRWVGRDDPSLRYNLAMHALREGDLDAARRDLKRSLALQESHHGWLALGVVEQRRGAWRDALEAYAAALSLNPSSVAALSREAQVWVRLGERGRAREALERALALAPERLDLKKRLVGL